MKSNKSQTLSFLFLIFSFADLELKYFKTDINKTLYRICIYALEEKR